MIVKSFAIERREGDPTSRQWIETRFLTKQEGEWYGYSYRWNDQGTDAELVPAKGLDKEFDVVTKDGPKKQAWHYPSRSECMVCHSRAQNYVLGLCTAQMDKVHEYPTGPEQQMRMLEAVGAFSFDWAAEAKNRWQQHATAKKLTGKAADDYVARHAPMEGQRTVVGNSLYPTTPPGPSPDRLVNPYDDREDLTRRAKSWLHANCSSCHVEAGGGNALMELGMNTSLDGMRIVDVKPNHATFDLPDARLVAPGSPERSVLFKRMSMRGPGQMPPLASTRVDEAGVKLMREWIATLKPKPAPAK